MPDRSELNVDCASRRFKMGICKMVVDGSATLRLRR